jgi:hypothetical protein
MGLLKENFVLNKSYSRKSAESLLADAGIVEFDYFPFCQEFDTDGRFGAACARLMQPTRHIYSFGVGTGFTPGASVATLSDISVEK